MSYRHTIAHRITELASWFANIAQQPFAMLLDSAAPQHINSRFDMLVMSPIQQLTFRDGQSQLKSAAGVESSNTDPFQLIRNGQASLPAWPDTEGSDLPFVGGWLGYFGYDAGRIIEKLPSLACDDIPLPDIAVGLYDWALVLDKQSQTLWHVDLTGNAEQHWPDRAKALGLHFQDDIWQQIEPSPLATGPFNVGTWQANLDKAGYLDRFSQVQAYLQSGDCYQINLAQRFSASFAGSPWAAYSLLRQHNQAPFSAFICLEQGAVLSISPERFIEVKQQRIETKPIKGTRPRHADPKQDEANASALAASPKDRAENVMIVDLLRNDLGKVAQPGSVKVPHLFAIESFPAVHHLVSTITAELAAPYTAIDALYAAFPGGSITGAPKVRAMQIIEELEPHRRSVYCGSIGYLSQHGHMDTNIAIRSLVVANQQIHCWAGGGIVADSDGEAEYQETFDKVARILPILTKASSQSATQSPSSASKDSLA